jgi:hypothetical protein
VFGVRADQTYRYQLVTFEGAHGVGALRLGVRHLVEPLVRTKDRAAQRPRLRGRHGTDLYRCHDWPPHEVTCGSTEPIVSPDLRRSGQRGLFPAARELGAERVLGLEP